MLLKLLEILTNEFSFRMALPTSSPHLEAWAGPALEGTSCSVSQSLGLRGMGARFTGKPVYYYDVWRRSEPRGFSVGAVLGSRPSRGSIEGRRHYEHVFLFFYGEAGIRKRKSV